MRYGGVLVTFVAVMALAVYLLLTQGVAVHVQADPTPTVTNTVRLYPRPTLPKCSELKLGAGGLCEES